MKWFHYISLGFLFCMPLQAQQETTVFGTLVNRQTSQALEFVSVIINADTNNAQPIGTLTNATGYFELTGLPNGNYSLTFSLAGYVSQVESVLVFAGNNNYDLGDIRLAVSNHVIEEITVLGQQNDIGPTLDSRIFNLEDNIAQSTGSLLDVMRTLPGVTVEQALTS